MWELILWMQSSFITVISSEAACLFYNKACKKRFWASESMQIYLKYEVYSQDCLLLVTGRVWVPSPSLPPHFFGVMNMKNLNYNVIKEA